MKRSMFSLLNILLIAAAVLSALIAGLFYAWSCSIIPGLAKLDGRTYVSAMQSFNKAILNPVFFLSFMGTLIMLPVATFAHFHQPLSARFWLLLGATVLYVVGVFGVTAFGNVPLNNMLSSFDLPSASNEAINSVRAKFEAPWNSLHSIRTVASIVVLLLVVCACVRGEN
ncbi:DUF1772 domain-containing protein [Chitinophagaceae bacterium 26-R-25]|nr:DUF1772 domain-containing protein [Chitinophagaceae bacterium 26-R-25]